MTHMSHDHPFVFVIDYVHSAIIFIRVVFFFFGDKSSLDFGELS